MLDGDPGRHLRDGSGSPSTRPGRPWFNATRARERAHQIEQVGAELREMMPFLDPVRDPLRKTETEDVKV